MFCNQFKIEQIKKRIQYNYFETKFCNSKYTKFLKEHHRLNKHGLFRTHQINNHV